MSMSVAAAQAQKFYEQVAKQRRLYTFRDDGHLLFFGKDSYQVVPFWSGGQLTGYDITVEDLVKNLEHHTDRLTR